MVPLRKVMLVLYPAVHAKYRLPIGYNRQITSLKHSRTVDGRWHKLTTGKHTRSEALRHIG